MSLSATNAVKSSYNFHVWKVIRVWPLKIIRNLPCSSKKHAQNVRCPMPKKKRWFQTRSRLKKQSSVFHCWTIPNFWPCFLIYTYIQINIASKKKMSFTLNWHRSMPYQNILSMIWVAVLAISIMSENWSFWGKVLITNKRFEILIYDQNEIIH